MRGKSAYRDPILHHSCSGFAHTEFTIVCAHILPHFPKKCLGRILQDVQQRRQHFSALRVSRVHCVQLRNLLESFVALF